jgi:hypothetical protein
MTMIIMLSGLYKSYCLFPLFKILITSFATGMVSDEKGVLEEHVMQNV